MTLSKSSILRVDEAGGKTLRTFQDGASAHIQGVVVTNQEGDQVGILNSPLVVTIASSIGAVATEKRGHYHRYHFADWVDNRHFGTYVDNPNGTGASKPILLAGQSGGLRLFSSVAALGRAGIVSHAAAPTLPGIGMLAEFTLRIHEVATVSGGRKARFGFGDTTNGIYIEYDGNSTEVTLKAVKAGASQLSVDGSDWDVPISIAAGTLKNAIQVWGIRFDYASSRVELFLDGALVHAETGDRTTPLVGHPDMPLRVEVAMTSLGGVASELFLYGIGLVSEGSDPRWNKRFHVSSNNIPIASPSDSAVTLLSARTGITGDTSSINRKVSSLRKVILSGRATATDTYITYEIVKGLYEESAPTILPISNKKAPKDPADAWVNVSPTNQTAVTLTLGGEEITLSGYAAGDDVRYKVTATSAVGETTAATFLTDQVGVGTPAMEMIVQIQHPIPWAKSYRIYREVGTSGDYYLVGEVDPYTMITLGFTDIGYVGVSTIEPPISNTADHCSFIKAEIVSDFVNPIGTNSIASGQISLNGGPHIIEFEPGEVPIYPGENLAVVSTIQASAGVLNCTMEWDEA